MRTISIIAFIAVHCFAVPKVSAADGLPLWTNHCGSGGWLNAIAVDSNGDALVAGNNLVVKYSNAGVPVWTNRHGKHGNVGPRSLAVDTAGDVIVTGIFDSDDTGNDFELIKYSSAGVPLWTNRYAGYGTGADWPRGLAVDRTGNIFVTGFSENQSFLKDIVTIAYAPTGLPLWTNRYDGPNNRTEDPAAIAVDADGNVFVTGTTESLYSPTAFTTIKYAGAGIPLWTNYYGNGITDYAEARAITIDKDGNVLITGYSYDYGGDYATIKYSNAGLPLWTNRYTGPGGLFDVPRAIGTDHEGKVFVTGISATVDGKYHYATLAYTSTGTALWTNLQEYGQAPNSDGGAEALAVDWAGNVTVAGAVMTTNTYRDFLTIKYSNSGVPLWTNRYGNIIGFEDRAVAAAVDGSGNVFVAGPSLASNTQSGYEYVTIKYYGLPRPTPLDFNLSNGRIVLSWTNAVFSLEFAPDANGPFLHIPGATSPFTNDIADVRKFFRLKAD